jgi:antagonist of KipI
MSGLRVVEPGFLSSIQDLGRFGLAHLGISPCGAADAFSLRVGNRLAGNPDSAAAIEMTLAGGTFLFEQETVFAITGSDFGASVGGRPVTGWTATHAEAGAQLRLGSAHDGARCYLCVSGGIAVPEFLGSASTDLRANFGGLEGRPLRKGDRLEIGPSANPLPGMDARQLRYYVRHSTLRVTRGPQAHCFPSEALGRLCDGVYTISNDSSRLGIRLIGDPIRASSRVQLLTEGVSLGAVQVPPDGQPIILFVDQQTTGGYAKLANVILADLARVGQLAPQGKVRFVEVDVATAHAALREREAHLKAVLRGGA